MMGLGPAKANYGTRFWLVFHNLVLFYYMACIHHRSIVSKYQHDIVKMHSALQSVCDTLWLAYAGIIVMIIYIYIYNSDIGCCYNSNINRSAVNSSSTSIHVPLYNHSCYCNSNVCCINSYITKFLIILQGHVYDVHNMILNFYVYP